VGKHKKKSELLKFHKNEIKDVTSRISADEFGVLFRDSFDDMKLL
jgi:hypothetical protein